MDEYFTARSNVLGYSLFLPLISLPTLWFIDLLGNHFVFFILYLWTIIAFMIILSVHIFFREYTTIGKWCWTPSAIGSILILFLINLFYYIPFLVSGSDAYPEVMAVVFTNIVLLALAGTLMYEINRTLFNEPAFSLFGTTVCLFSSSYFFWTTGCKDHILALLLFCGILLCLVKFLRTRDSWYLPLAFLITGLLAWARPELALWVVFAVCGVWGYTFIDQLRKRTMPGYVLLVSPVFTIIGALPFFLNNCLVTKHPLIPTGALYLPKNPAGSAIQVASFAQHNAGISGFSLPGIITMKKMVPSTNLPGDILGVLFQPINGSMGVLSLTPLFLVMAVLAVVLIMGKKIRFSREEKTLAAIIALLAVSVFLAYAGNIPGLNTSYGITPDIRYLSPAYLPLTLLGLTILKKIPGFPEKSLLLMKMMLVICAIGIPVSLVGMSAAYANQGIADQLNAPLDAFFTGAIFLLAVITFIAFIHDIFTNQKKTLTVFLLALLCSAPFLWQVDISIYTWQFAIAEGYPAWIPVTRILGIAFSFPHFLY